MSESSSLLLYCNHMWPWASIFEVQPSVELKSKNLAVFVGLDEIRALD